MKTVCVEPLSSVNQDELLNDVNALSRLIRQNNVEISVNPYLLFEKLEKLQHLDNSKNMVLDDVFGDKSMTNSDADFNTGNMFQPAAGDDESTRGTFFNSMAYDYQFRLLNHNEQQRSVNAPFDESDGNIFQNDISTDNTVSKPEVITIPDEILDKDVSSILEMFPTKTKEYIKTCMQRHSASPDQVQETIFDLLNEEDSNANRTGDKNNVITIDDPQPSTSKLNNKDDQIEECWNWLKDILPDADPDFLYTTAQNIVGNQDKFQETVNSLLDRREYPKLKETLKLHNREAVKQMNFTVESFLEMYDDPIQYFYQTQRPKTENYRNHMYTYLCNTFPTLPRKTIDDQVIANNYSLIRSYNELQWILNTKGPPAKRQKTNPNVQPQQWPLPDEPDELFYRELAFMKLENDIKDYLNMKKALRASKIMLAKETNDLITCCCCYEDELLLEEIIMCDQGHMFCTECIRKSSEENIGQDKLIFPCLYADCEDIFLLSTLKKVLKPITFTKLLQKMQEDEIKQAEIPDLVDCPFCSFCAIVPNPEEKVFKCLNPECMKESCRFCKEPNHLPLRCEEIETGDEVSMRTYIENKMTDALLRTCPNCHRRFIKESGCNKMMCKCGKMMCYVCRKIIEGYQHFSGSSRCSQFTDDYQLHVAPVKDEATRAKEEYLASHPELKNLNLKHDPSKNLGQPNQSGQIINEPDSESDDDSYFADDDSLLSPGSDTISDLSLFTTTGSSNSNDTDEENDEYNFW